MKKEMRERLREASREVYGDGKLLDYVMSKTSQVAEVHGLLLTVERQRIEKDFCFRYSDDSTGEDYDRAIDMVAKAYNSDTYFRAYNMRTFNEDLAMLRENLELLHGQEKLPEMIAVAYLPSRGNLTCLGFRRPAAVIEASGPVFVRELPGKELRESRCSSVYIPTEDELRAIIAAYEAAAQEHRKKVDNYLKRYGLSKVRAWSYWRDE